MSTRCRIGIKNSDGTIESIYCHHDGYVSYVGSILVNHYKTEDKIRKLLDLGDMSSLGTEPMDNPDGWDFNKRQIGDNTMCTTYRRRGEDAPSKTSKDEEEYLKLTDDCWGEYCYLFDNGTWIFSSYGKSKFKPVKEDSDYESLR